MIRLYVCPDGELLKGRKRVETLTLNSVEWAALIGQK